MEKASGMSLESEIGEGCSLMLMSSTAKEIGGTAFQSQHSAYKDWLNSMQNKKHQSIWREGVDLIPQTPEKDKSGKDVVRTSEYLETEQYIGAVKESFNALSSTDGLGTK
jgi:thiaminase